MEQNWWNRIGGTELVEQNWWNRIGGTELVEQNWWNVIGETETVGQSGLGKKLSGTGMNTFAQKGIQFTR